MKTIIAGTDFSPASLNACKYAAFLASKLHCKLMLFNLFETPIIHSNVGLYGISFTAQKSSSNQKTKALALQLQKEFPKIKIDYFTTFGDLKTEIENFTSTHKVQAAVMGLSAKDKISKFIFESSGIRLAGKINCPVIIVPSNYKDHNLSKILLAVDTSEKLLKPSLAQFEKFVSDSKSRLNVLHVRTENEIGLVPVKTIKLNGKNLPIETIRSKDIQSGVKKACAGAGINMVSIISKKHSVFYNLFFETTTKKIVFSAKIPVMAIHE